MGARSILYLAAGVCLAVSGCGPNRALVRQYLQNSAHRRIVIPPLDKGNAEKDLTQQAAQLLASKLVQAGFLVVARGKGVAAYQALKIRNQGFDNLDTVAAYGREVGADAVLIGLIEAAYEHGVHRVPVFEYVMVPPPACCGAVSPCRSRLIFDPLVQSYVSSCSPTHRRITIDPGANRREAGFSVRLRLVDAKTKSILWESREQWSGNNVSVYRAADSVTDILAARLTEDTVKQRL